MAEPRWVIYGANGYTGRLAAIRARELGLRPTLAGRNGPAIEALAAELELEALVVDLLRPDRLREALATVDLVLSCAGPFAATAAPLLDACLATRTHYLDITGEIDVFEATFARDGDARREKIVVLPGVGFDVVPTDCLAVRLAAELPGSDLLEIAIAPEAGPSAGTMKTGLAQVGLGRVRSDGKLARVPFAHRVKEVDFADRTREVVTIPWGDLSTAYRSTSIPNIICYAGLPSRMRPWLALTSWVGPILRTRPLRGLAERWIERNVQGPDATSRARARTHVWARVVRAREERSATLDLPEAYAFTAVAAVESARRVLGSAIEPGAWTPAQAFGADFVMGLGDVELRLCDTPARPG